MKYNAFHITAAALLTGCSAFQPAETTSHLEPAQATTNAELQAVAFEQEVIPSDPGPALVAEPLQQPADLASASPPPAAVPRRLPPQQTGLTLASLEEAALANNPVVKQAHAKVRALCGKRLQAGLPPNPTIGYQGSEIGNGSAAGQQGAYVGQEFIVAHKLQRDQAIVSAEIRKAYQDVAAAERRVKTDVQARFYETLLAQRRVELAGELSRLANRAASASQALLDAQEIPVAGLLQTEVQQQNALLQAATAQNRLEQAWRELSAVLGAETLPPQPLAGDLTPLPEPLDWELELARLRTESPELSAAIAEVERARRVLNRECVEPRPNITGQVGVQYDYSSSDTITSVQIGMPLPLWNRNQGAISQARAEITRTSHNVDRLELALQQRLARAFRDYADARVTAETYLNEVLPRSQRTFQLVQSGYQEGEIGYLALLAAQQTNSQTNLAYLDALGNLWRSKVLIDGLLLEESLSAEY
ncbi:Cobalt-zinc-cadmium resistance protein CzcC precursor [Posidoniimonas polymericola]|uniref:Cobalt-zinc-cadmium resistance protein CzcC n=1 Tax=Posidoniimonas polymericola TaxID=2528002 RepID=A0A5C5XZ39_9BACT|nr:TolC family protein [Posidoniimonas polymericola]TWT66752.1 Cobalt-zinc-cadmium resistance protein CzcC precursor [Posidoniimonas polymericola]